MMVIYSTHHIVHRFLPAGKSTTDFRNKKRNNNSQQRKAASIGML